MIQLFIESVMCPSISIRNKKYSDSLIQTEQLEKYEVGKRYPDFNMIEPFISEYNVDLTTLKVNDVIIRDWQYGHIKNTGYIPLKVIEPFNGIRLIVETTNNKLRQIVYDNGITKDATYHKLDKKYLFK